MGPVRQPMTWISPKSRLRSQEPPGSITHLVKMLPKLARLDVALVAHTIRVSEIFGSNLGAR